MEKFTHTELRALNKEELDSIKYVADHGDDVAQWKMAMCILYAQKDMQMSTCIDYLEKAADKNAMASKLLGLSYCGHLCFRIWRRTDR